MKITFISDTHTKHQQITNDLPGGDLLIHAGDIMNSGYSATDVVSFARWFDSIDNYNHKVFIAGNHDRMFQIDSDYTLDIVESYKTIQYLQDNWMAYVTEDAQEMCKIYGSPWQPEFHNWAFNLPKGGKELQEKWDAIPTDVDILITHGPALGILDTSGPPYNEPNLGCGLLTNKIKEIKPKIHVCGHIHGGHGYRFDGNTHFINASVLDERYAYVNKPLTANWNPNTNELSFI